MTVDTRLLLSLQDDLRAAKTQRDEAVGLLRDVVACVDDKEPADAKLGHVMLAMDSTRSFLSRVDGKQTTWPHSRG